MDFKILLKSVLSAFLLALPITAFLSEDLKINENCIVSSEVANLGCNHLYIYRVSNSGYSNYYSQVWPGETARIYFQSNYRYAFYADGEMMRQWSPEDCQNINQYVDTKGCREVCDEGSLTLQNNSDCEAEVYINTVMSYIIPANGTLTTTTRKNWQWRLQINGEHESIMMYRATDDCDQTVSFSHQCPPPCEPLIDIVNPAACDAVLVLNNSATRVVGAGTTIRLRTEPGWTWQMFSIDQRLSSLVYEATDACIQGLSYEVKCPDPVDINTAEQDEANSDESSDEDEDSDDDTDETAEAEAAPCTVVSDDSFETGWGAIWFDGGSDCTLIRDPNRANEGEISVRLRDNSMMASSMYTRTMNLVGADLVKLDFSFLPVSFEVGESFIVEYSTDGGKTFKPIYEWILGSENFSPNRQNVSLDIEKDDLSDRTLFRIRCNASSNHDLLYIDNVYLEVCTDEASAGILAETVVTESRSDIFDEETDLSVQIMPTIATDFVNMKYAGISEGFAQVQMADLTGRVILQEKINNEKGSRRIDMSGYAEGLYIISLISDEGILHTQKIIKQ